MTSTRYSLLAATALAAVMLAACSQSDSGIDMADGDHSMHDMNDMVDGAMDHSMHEGMEMANADTPLGHGADYAENFRLIDQNGESHELFYHKDKDAIVIMTAGNGCPIVRGAVPDLKQIREDYAEQNVQFFMLNSNLQDTREEIAAEAEEFGYDFAILKDENQLVGEQLNFDRTAQVYVINPKKGFKVEYYGPLNDRQTYERQRPTATETYVRDVLDAVIAGDEVTTEAPAIRAGCMVNFPERKKKGMTAEPISYSTDVAPILKEKCVECHQPGGIGPWSMTGGYQEIAGWAPMIRETIRTNRMPPWHADPAIGTFHGDRSLSGEEIKTIVHWVEDGAPRGEGEDPLVGLDLHAPDWPLGEPDLILTLPAYTVPATGVVDYVHPAIENPLTEDKWLKATTIKAGDRQSVHHVLSGYISDMPEDGLGTTDLWEFSTGGYAVGAESNVQAENTGVPFPAGGAIGFQVHYTPYGKEAEDVTQIGFYFQDKPELLNRTAVILDASIEIPPGEARHSETAYMEFPYDAILTSAFPHAHYRGYSSKLTVLYPDGREELVLNLPRYDFNWQRGYAWDEPLELPAGTKVIAEYVYDNSKANPANPDAGITVTWGDQSFEEMLYTSLTYRWKGETTDNLLAEQTRELEETRFFTALDDDIDGRLTEAELKGMLGQRMKANFERMDMNSDGAIDKQEYITINRLMRARGQQ